MNIRDLDDSNLIHYLLYTDFEQVTLSADEYKYLLNKYNYFYKSKLLINSSLLQSVKELRANVTKEKENSAKIASMKYDEIESLKLKVHQLSNRKLTFKERIFGKIKLNKNDKR